MGNVSVCPSGLRGYVQVVMFSNSWVQIPQPTFCSTLPAPDGYDSTSVIFDVCRIPLARLPLLRLPAPRASVLHQPVPRKLSQAYQVPHQSVPPQPFDVYKIRRQLANGYKATRLQASKATAPNSSSLSPLSISFTSIVPRLLVPCRRFSCHCYQSHSRVTLDSALLPTLQ